MFDYDNEGQAIARCEECGEVIFEGSSDIYMDEEHNYFCGIECALNYHGIFLAEDCLVGED